MKNVLTTACPPSIKMAAWCSKTRPCIYCKATIIKRRETSDGPVLDVQHHPKCNAMKEV